MNNPNNTLVETEAVRNCHVIVLNPRYLRFELTSIGLSNHAQWNSSKEICEFNIKQNKVK